MKKYLFEFEIVSLDMGKARNISVITEGDTITQAMGKAYDKAWEDVPDFIDSNSITYAPIIQSITQLEGAEIL